MAKRVTREKKREPGHREAVNGQRARVAQIATKGGKPQKGEGDAKPEAGESWGEKETPRNGAFC